MIHNSRPKYWLLFHNVHNVSIFTNLEMFSPLGYFGDIQHTLDQWISNSGMHWNHLKQSAEPHTYGFWFSWSGVEPTKLHFQQAPRCCWWCWSRDHSLKHCSGAPGATCHDKYVGFAICQTLRVSFNIWQLYE